MFEVADRVNTQTDPPGEPRGASCADSREECTHAPNTAGSVVPGLAALGHHLAPATLARRNGRECSLGRSASGARPALLLAKLPVKVPGPAPLRCVNLNSLSARSGLINFPAR